MNRWSTVARHLGLMAVGAVLLTSVVVPDDSAAGSSRNRIMVTRDLLRAATAGFDSGKYEDALAVLDSILVVDSANPDAYFLKGKIMLAQGDSAGAINVLSEAVQKAPRSTRVKLLLSRIYLKQGEAESSVALTKEVLSIKPMDGEASYLHGWGLLLSGDTAQAVELFEAALLSNLDGNNR